MKFGNTQLMLYFPWNFCLLFKYNKQAWRHIMWPLHISSQAAIYSGTLGTYWRAKTNIVAVVKHIVVGDNTKQKIVAHLVKHILELEITHTRGI